MGSFVIPLVPGTFLSEQSQVFGSWPKPCCQGLNNSVPPHPVSSLCWLVLIWPLWLFFPS